MQLRERWLAVHRRDKRARCSIPIEAQFPVEMHHRRQVRRHAVVGAFPAERRNLRRFRVERQMVALDAQVMHVRLFHGGKRLVNALPGVRVSRHAQSCQNPRTETTGASHGGAGRRRTGV